MADPAVMARIRQIESKGDYNARNPSGAWGGYQIMHPQRGISASLTAQPRRRSRMPPQPNMPMRMPLISRAKWGARRPALSSI